MIAVGAALVVAALLSVWALGELAARALFGPRHARVAPELRPVLGVVAATLVLELSSYFVPVRIAGWLPALLALPGFYLLAKPGSTLRRARAELLPLAIAVLLGLVPLVIAGRLTVAAMTNDDATFYLAAADRLLDAPGGADLAALSDSCLRERLLRGWYWRTGTSNLVAAIATVARIPTPGAVLVVTSLLLALVPAPALALARRATSLRVSRRSLAGSVAALSAAAVFLAYQHFLGQLAAYSLFPLSLGASFSAFRRGGIRRTVLAGALLAASVAHFADAAAVLVALVGVAALAAGRRPSRLAVRVLCVALATAALGPITLLRAGGAAYRTLTVRMGAPGPVFPQRGWIAKILPDHLLTVTGVDPWPPWPSAWPPTVPSGLAALGALSGVVLVVLALRASRRREAWTFATVIAVGVVLAATLIRTPYVVGKATLLAAAFVTPVVALGAGLSMGVARLAAGAVALAELVALAQFLPRSRWTVVDTPAHDAMMRELGALPRGSLLALDGFGAPSDPVHDGHRAYRAAQAAGLLPIHAGLDGGFYRPRCADPPRPDPLPHDAYALGRATSEELSVGRELSRFGEFRLRVAHLDDPANLVATFAPTEGFLRAEMEAGIGPFRWAEARAAGTLRVVSRAECVRLRGELRTAGPEGLATLRAGDETIFGGVASPRWAPFTTSPLSTLSEQRLEFRFAASSGAAPDPAHAVAYRRLALEVDESCVRLVGAVTGEASAGEAVVRLPMTFAAEAHAHLAPAVGIECGRIRLGVAADPRAEIGTSLDGEPVHWHALGGERTDVVSDAVRFSRAPSLGLFRRGGAAESASITALALEPRPCPP